MKPNDTKAALRIYADRLRKTADQLDELCEIERPKLKIRDRIIALRRANRRLTQQAIAERIGTSPNYVWMVLHERA